MGLKMLTAEQYQAIPQRSTYGAGDLPAAVDLTAKFPSPGSQGAQSSCVAWAVGYAVKSYQEALDHKWDVRTHTFSPAYIYNQINRGFDQGSTFSDALNLLVSQGDALNEDMPYRANDWTTQPSQAAITSASHHLAKSWARILPGDVKAALASGTPVLIGVRVYPDLRQLNTKNRIYDNYSGTDEGGHALVIIGYDDAQNAYKFLNSWGDTWGISGYGYISYDLVNDHVAELYVVEDVAETKTLSSIAVSTLPNKTQYFSGETFTSTGMVVTATYSDGSSSNFSGWTTSTPTMTRTGTQAVTVTASEAGVTRSTSFNITITAQTATLSSIAITTSALTTAFNVGDVFSTAGVVVTATYSNATTHVITGWTASAPSMQISGVKTVTITYTENAVTKTASYPITVTARTATLSSIAVSALPMKTSYVVGEAFSSSGLAITATFSDASSHIVTGWTLSSPSTSSAGSPTVIVTYTEAGVTKVTTFAITVVQASSLSYISITSLPTKIAYAVGDTFSATGLSVAASYTDGTSNAVTGWSVSAPSMTSAGTKSVTVTYAEGSVTRTATFSIIVAVAAPVLTSIVVSADKAEDAVGSESGLTFTIRTYDQSNNLLDLTDTTMTFSPSGSVTVKRTGSGTYSYTLKGTQPAIVSNATFAKGGISSNSLAYKLFKWGIQEALPYTNGSSGNVMRVTAVYLNYLWVPSILVDKTGGQAFLNGGQITLRQGSPSGTIVSYRDAVNTTTSIELSFSVAGTYYVTSGSMYVGAFNIIKLYR
ncbi:hypothetical protein GCM10027046_13450 [Uliginosibacterium flavum]